MTMPLLSLFLLLLLHPSSSQPITPAPAPAPLSDLCNGIFISYHYTGGVKLHPLKKGPKQPYSFKSTLSLLNNDEVALKSWEVFVGFQHHELLVSADGGLLANGSTLPALVGNGTIVVGYPDADLKTAIQTAGDLDAVTARVNFQGTQFGVKPPNVPLPNNISLTNEGYICSPPSKFGMSSLDSFLHSFIHSC